MFSANSLTLPSHPPCHPEDVRAIATALERPGVQLVLPPEGTRSGSAARRSLLAAVVRSLPQDTPVLRIRGDCETARQCCLVDAMSSLGWPEAHVRHADHPRTGCLRYLAEHPEAIVWIDDVSDRSIIEDLLPRLTRYKSLITFASPPKEDWDNAVLRTLRPTPIETAESWLDQRGGLTTWRQLTGENRQRLLASPGLLQVWTALSAGGGGTSVPASSLEELAADWWRRQSSCTLSKLLALWCCIDWELSDPSGLLSAAAHLGIDSETATTTLQAALTAELLFPGLGDQGLLLDSEWHAALARSLPAELRTVAATAWGQCDFDRASSAAPQHHAVHLYRLTQAAEPTTNNVLDRPDGWLRCAIDSCRSMGAWRTGAELAARLLRQVEARGGAGTPAVARAWRRLSMLQQAGNQLLAARKSARLAEEILEASGTAELSDVCAIKCDIAELDLAEGRSERAFHRLDALRSLLQTAHLDRLLVARWMFLRGACLLAGKELERSERLLRRAWEIRRELLEEDAEDLLAIRSLLARNVFAQRRWDDAETLLVEDLRIRRASPRVTPSESAVAANLLADLYFAQGRFSDAEPLLEEVLRVRQQTLDDDDRLLAEAASRLGSLKSSRGDYASADRCFRLALSLTERIFGEEHPRVAAILNELAKMLFTQSRHDQSRRLLERAIGIQQRSLRKGDLRITESRNNLAAIYVARGFYDQAAKLYAENLHTARQQRAGDHPTLATTLNNLGDVFRSQGRYREAEEMLLEALAMRERLHGPDHPVVAQSLSNLAYLRMLGGQAAAARNDVERALNIRRQALGPSHPHTGNSLTTLGRLSWRAGDYEQALDAFQQAAEIHRQGLGEKSQQYGASLAALGRCELRVGQPAKAELHLLKSRMLLEDTVGANHRLYAESLLGLAELSESEGRYNDAFPSFERALTIQRQTLGSDRYEVAETLVCLGHNLLRRGVAASAEQRFDEAERLLNPMTEPPEWLVVEFRRGQAEMYLELRQPERADACLRQALTLSPATVAGPLRNALLNLQAAAALAGHRYGEAEQLLYGLLADGEAEHGPDARELVPILDQLAASLSLRNRAAEAEPLVRRGIDILERRLGRQHVETATRLNHLAALLQRLDRLEESRQLRDEVIAIHEAKGDQNPAPLVDALQKQAELLYRLKRSGEASVVEERAASLRNRTSHVLEDIL